MNEIMVEATGLPLRFPDPREEAYARAQEFRRLSPQQRLQSMLEVFETGMMLIRQSPKRQLLDQMYLKREDQWRRIQQELFARAQ